MSAKDDDFKADEDIAVRDQIYQEAADAVMESVEVQNEKMERCIRALRAATGALGRIQEIASDEAPATIDRLLLLIQTLTARIAQLAKED